MEYSNTGHHAMFTAEFSARDRTEHILGANHFVETGALQLSLAFVLARID